MSKALKHPYKGEVWKDGVEKIDLSRHCLGGRPKGSKSGPRKKKVNTQEKLRNCLGFNCGKVFLSQWCGNRLCDNCRRVMSEDESMFTDAFNTIKVKKTANQTC